MKLVGFTKMNSSGLGSGEVFVNAETIFAVEVYDNGNCMGAKIISTTGQEVKVIDSAHSVSRKLREEGI